MTNSIHRIKLKEDKIERNQFDDVDKVKSEKK